MQDEQEAVDERRRRLCSGTAIALGTAPLTFLHSEPAAAKPRYGSLAQAPARAAAFGPVRQIEVGPLDMGYVDIGSPGAPPVILLHGWPYDIHAFTQAASMLAATGRRVIVPHLRGFGTTLLRSSAAPRNGQQAVFAVDIVGLMDALNIPKALLAGFDWGARTANVIAALWPERCTGLVSVSGYLIGSQQTGKTPLPPKAERDWWYQFYFATERGGKGYEQNRDDFARLIWQSASPRWAFDEAAFQRSSASLANPDHAAIVVHNYRWRLGLAQGESQFDPIEALLSAMPTISVPTISMEGDANGAPHPEPASYAKKFSGKYAHRLITGGVGHNLPQEAPRAFADAVIAIDSL